MQPSFRGESFVRILGGGQEVGRSCLLVNVGDRSVLLDCGMRPGKNHEDRMPRLDEIRVRSLDAVVITHYHVDHIGALPYLTEILGYRGPVYMTQPTQDIGRLVLRDYVHVNAEGVPFSFEHVDKSLARARIVDTAAEVQVAPGLQFSFFYAGHAVGAVAVQVVVHGRVVLYTGDFSTFPEALLGAANFMGAARPDVLIVEATYAGRMRDTSRKEQERALLQDMALTLQTGGKVLIPAFAVGRTQELQLILSSYWRRLALGYPIYVSSPLAGEATSEVLRQHSQHAAWFSQNCRTTLQRDLTRPAGLRPEDRATVLNPRAPPMVVIAAPAMLNAGFSREVFRSWCVDAKNLVALPGYGYSDRDEQHPGQVRCKVKHFAMSAHTDGMGIFQLVRRKRPDKVIMVHGELPGMQKLTKLLKADLNVRAHAPSNGDHVRLFRFGVDTTGNSGKSTAFSQHEWPASLNAADSAASEAAVERPSLLDEALSTYRAGQGSTLCSESLIFGGLTCASSAAADSALSHAYRKLCEGANPFAFDRALLSSRVDECDADNTRRLTEISVRSVATELVQDTPCQMTLRFAATRRDGDLMRQLMAFASESLNPESTAADHKVGARSASEHSQIKHEP